MIIDCGGKSWRDKYKGTVVFLDGEPLRGCVYADEDSGVAVVFAEDEFLRHVVTPDGFAMTIKRGNVRIMLPAGVEWEGAG